MKKWLIFCHRRRTAAFGAAAVVAAAVPAAAAYYEMEFLPLWPVLEPLPIWKEREEEDVTKNVNTS